MSVHDILFAKAFAHCAHGDQTYGGNKPYDYHLCEVVKIVAEYGETATIAAFLHDIVEGTVTTIGEVQEIFGQDVAKAVALCTDEPGANRKERKANTNAKLARAVLPEDRIGLIVKAADRLANVRRSVEDNPKLLKMYRGEHEAFREAAYRPGLCDEIWRELDQLIAENREKK